MENDQNNVEPQQTEPVKQEETFYDDEPPDFEGDGDGELTGEFRFGPARGGFRYYKKMLY